MWSSVVFFFLSLNDMLLSGYELFLVHTFRMNHICTSSRYWSGKWPAFLWRPKVLRRRLLWPPTAVILTHWSGGSYVFWVSYVTREGKHQFPSLYFISSYFPMPVFISVELFKTQKGGPCLSGLSLPQLAAVNPFNPHSRCSCWLVPIFWFFPLVPSCLLLFFNAGVYSFGLFATTIFANAGQVVTGHQTPHFLTACKPNYTALGCQSPLQYITEHRACTGNPYLVLSARKSFPSKDAALSFYSAVYTVVGNVWWLESKQNVQFVRVSPHTQYSNVEVIPALCIYELKSGAPLLFIIVIGVNIMYIKKNKQKKGWVTHN